VPTSTHVRFAAARLPGSSSDGQQNSSLTVARQRGVLTRFPVLNGRSERANQVSKSCGISAAKCGKQYSPEVMRVKRKGPALSTLGVASPLSLAVLHRQGGNSAVHFGYSFIS